MATATVREAITTAALLKLPRTMPAAEKRAHVDGVLADLDLETCQVGQPAIRGEGVGGGRGWQASGPWGNRP